MRRARPTQRLASVLLVAALAAVPGCDGGDAAESEDTSQVASDLLGSSRPQPQSSLAPDPAPPRETVSEDIDPATLGYDVGPDDAPLKIVEFSDFACGYCRQFHMETWSILEEEYVETGKVQWKYIPMVLGIFGPNAEEAAEAAECAMVQGHFPAVRDRLFEDQPLWKRADDVVPVLRGLVVEEGVDGEQWDRCMAEGTRTERVQQGTTLSRQVGVRGTPTFFLVGFGSIPGAVPAATFRQILDAAVADAAARAGRGGGSGG